MLAHIDDRFRYGVRLIGKMGVFPLGGLRGGPRDHCCRQVTVYREVCGFFACIALQDHLRSTKEKGR